jgi:homoserine O-succinyltransferase
MPIIIPSDLPAYSVLQKERVSVMSDVKAARQDIRPLEVVIFNLMPDKISTEVQIMRLLGSTPLQVNVTLLHPATHTSKNTAADHLQRFYKVFDDVRDRAFDAMIITGAPVEQMPFDQVNYWEELSRVLDWAAKHVYSSFFLCWGAQAALQYYHGVPKHNLPAKMFGVYKHRAFDPHQPLTNGFDDEFYVPVSRHTEVRADDIESVGALEILASSEESGVCLVQDKAQRRVYMFNHLEYDSETLHLEFQRDQERSLGTAIPHNYYPDDDPSRTPRITWRAHRNLLFGNWLNMVYQGTPYDLSTLL